MEPSQDFPIRTKNVVKLDKLVKIELVYGQKSNDIHSIKITGDFFLHPEETIEVLEEGLRGSKLEREDVRNKIQSILKDSQFYGFDVESLADAILDCKRR